jgi:beta-lactamase regulating signal transducer with metallopeptidase domain
MSDEPISSLIEFNLAISGAVIVALLLRKTVRRALGAHAAYALWLLVPAAGLATLVPGRVVDAAEIAIDISGGSLAAAGMEATSLFAAASQFAPWVWAVGAAAMLLWHTLWQVRFTVDLKRGQAGPAVVGFFRPRVVVPSDFRARYTLPERALIRQHERIHLVRHDSRINTLAVFLQCACWFNPLIHIGAHAMRIDQEMSCDAAVVGRRPRARRHYAEALLKTQLAASPLPVGCYWPGGTQHPLSERIVMLNQAYPSVLKRLAATVLVFGLAAIGGVGSWVAQPASAAPQQDQFGDFTGATFDAKAPVLITGPISRVDARDGGYLVHVTDTRSGKAWIVTGTSGGGFDVEDMRSKVGVVVKIRGYQTANRACNPACVANGRDITVVTPQ